MEGKELIKKLDKLLNYTARSKDSFYFGQPIWNKECEICFKHPAIKKVGITTDEGGCLRHSTYFMCNHCYRQWVCEINKIKNQHKYADGHYYQVTTVAELMEDVKKHYYKQFKNILHKINELNYDLCCNNKFCIDVSLLQKILKELEE